MSFRPKRAAEDFARSVHGTTDDNQDGPSAKKPRFDTRNPSALAADAPEEDAILDADEIGRKRANVKRNAVNIDGYDSDSENESFDARAKAKAKQKLAAEKRKDEDQDDMFADLEEDFKDADEEEEGLGGKAKKKAVRFLNEDEIEGQVAHSKSGGHVSADFSLTSQNRKGKNRALDEDKESSSESEVDDETRAAVTGDVDEEVGAGGKKEHAPKLDAFNMRAEQEEGRFDEQGNYVRKAADPDAVHDSWLEGVSKKDMKKAKEAAEKREEERRQKNMAEDALLMSDILKTLISLLQPGETALEALARLGRGKDRKPKWQNKNKNRRKSENDTASEVDMAEEDPAEAKRKKLIESITEAADLLLGRGQPEIYDAERELLIRQWRRETGEEWVDPPAAENRHDVETDEPKMWEYRWSDARDGGEIHGPYDGPTMVSWNDAGYFGDGVEFRIAGDREEWSRVVDFV